MKKFLFVVFVLFLALAISITSSALLINFAKKKEIKFTNYDVNLVKQENISTLSGSAGDEAVINFEQKTSINTLALSEVGQIIKEFEIYYLNPENNQMTFIYRQDVIEDYRYCCFEIIETTKLSIKITKTLNNSTWELKSIDGYLMGKTRLNENFNVTAYVPTGYADYTFHKGHFKHINNINFLGSTNFDINGNFFWAPTKKADGTNIDGKIAFEKILKDIRSVVEPGTKIVTTFLGRSDTYSEIEVHNGAMTEEPNRSKLIQSVIDVCKNYDLDGVSFDYEHPRALTQANDWDVFFGFLKDLREELHKQLGKDKIITAAIASWAITIPLNFNHIKFHEVIDQVEVMSYDNFDHNGAHSAFVNDCYNFIEGINSQNKISPSNENSAFYTDLKRCNLGLPFYSRPTDKSAYWGNYYAVADKLGKFANLLEDEVSGGVSKGPNYYNSWQMIYDKTCYSLDKGLGGVMVWHYFCDVEPENPLSLWGAIGAAVKSRTEKVYAS